MDRLKRLQALQDQRSQTIAVAVAGRRKRVEARVLHVHAPQEDEERKRAAELKEMALRKRQEEELRMPKVVEIARPVVDEKVENELSSFSSSSDEEDHVLLKPVFVPKGDRQLTRQAEEEADDDDHEKDRQREAHALLAEYVRLESATWNKRKEEEGLEATSGAFDPKTVDDTDDLDEAAEFQAWKLRELLRIKRDRQEREARELEQIELERIRNLTEEERQEIDREKEAAWAKKSKEKSDYRFLQKYYHKGAFFGDAAPQSILERDFAQPTGSDRSRKDFLPESMQVKDFGKRGRTKWTHLTAEDTTDYHTGWGHRGNQANYRDVGKMAGMRGDLARPSAKRPRM